MKYSYHWLKELSGTKKSAEALGKLLMFHAFEVEEIVKNEHGLDGVTIGFVKELKKHPNADRLNVAKVDFGKGKVHTIVCGAPNIQEGQKVAVALPGTTLPGGIEIKEAELRGVKSEGMICSSKELGLSDDHGGILVLSQDAPVGALFAKHFGFEDSVLDIKILPDRGSDALSYEGMAREIAALDGYAPRFAKKPKKAIKTPSYNRSPKVSIEDKKSDIRYTGLYFQNISVSDSPLSLQVKLLLSGLRPINNIVDATNYLMLLTGQPMHAFDADKIDGGIVVRLAKKGEKLKLLNGETIKLSTEDLVIADQKKVLGLAGVMGGAQSMVTEKTKNIFLEVGVFDASSVRKTKVRHGLPTDASYRYERGLDPNLPDEALREAAALIPSLTGGKLSGMRDVYPKKVLPWKIKLSHETIEGVLGIKVPLFEVVQHLALLGLKVKKLSNQSVFEVIVPSRRPDLLDEWSLIEEIGRMKGYDKVPATAPNLPLLASPLNSGKRFERNLKNLLANIGFDEIMTYSFYGERDAEAARLSISEHLRLENPLSPDQNLLRMSLAPLMFRKIKENLRNFDSFSMFELGSVFEKHHKKPEPHETKQVLLSTFLDKKGEKGAAFYALKGKVEALLDSHGVKEVSFVAIGEGNRFPTDVIIHPSQSASIVVEGRVIGLMGTIHQGVAQSFGIPGERIAIAGISLKRLWGVSKDSTIFEPLQKFPYALRDVSITLDKNVTVAQVQEVFVEAGGELLKKFELFDIYEQESEKRLAFHLYFGASDRTLTTEEMTTVFEKIVLAIEEKVQGKI